MRSVTAVAFCGVIAAAVERTRFCAHACTCSTSDTTEHHDNCRNVAAQAVIEVSHVGISMCACVFLDLSVHAVSTPLQCDISRQE
jgi:hypothetical protein